MKVVTPLDMKSTHIAATAIPAIKVALHVIGDARNDVRIMRAATALVEAGYAVSIVDIAINRSQSEEHFQNIHFQHVIIPDWRTSKRFEPLFFVKAVQALLMSTVRLLRDKADVYHASDLNALPASCLAALFRRKPLVVDVYDLQFPAPETSVGFWRRSSWLIALMHKIVLPRCAAVIATSPLHAEAIRRRFQIAHVTLLRNILPYRKVQKSNLLRDHLGLAQHVQIALYQGNLQPDRQLDRLIRAASFLDKDVVIVLMGKNIGSTQEQLEALIASEGVGDHVKIIPPVPFQELLEWTASADIGLIIYSPDYSPNVKMCLPNKLFEFLMAGLPVLASQLDAVAEVIRAYDVGQILPSLSPKDIGEAISTMLKDQNGRVRMSRNALKVAQQEFHWGKESQQLIHLYSDVIAKNRE